MSTDSGAPRHDPHFVDLAKLPDVVSLEIRPRHFDQPRRVTRRGVDRFVSDAVEFTVRLSEAFPIRALGPALWVGNEALTTAEVDGLTYRFLAFEPEKLEPSSPIALGWSSPSEPRKVTQYRFTMPSTPPR
jgi:hypothetical protein